MNLAATIHTPTIRDIALDLADVKAQLAVHYARRGEPTDEQDADWSALEDRRAALEADFAAAFHVATGLRWSVAERCMS